MAQDEATPRGKRKVLVTGATGLVGSHVVRRLVADGHSVVAAVRAGANSWRLADLLGRVEIVPWDASAGWDRPWPGGVPDVCVHAAWPSVRGDALGTLAHADFLRDSLALVVSLARAGCGKFVGVGSCLEYDTDPGWFTEQSPTRPRDLYAASKLALHLVLEQLSAGGGMRTAWARLFQLYGPYEDPRRLVPAVIRSLLRGEPAETTPAEQVRDYLHVEDAAAAIALLATGSVCGAVNVASGAPVEVREVVRRLGVAAGRPDLLRVGALPYRAGEPAALGGDITRLRREVGWHPRYDLDTGLRQTVEWWRRFLPPVA